MAAIHPRSDRKRSRNAALLPPGSTGHAAVKIDGPCVFAPPERLGRGRGAAEREISKALAEIVDNTIDLAVQFVHRPPGSYLIRRLGRLRVGSRQYSGRGFGHVDASRQVETVLMLKGTAGGELI